MENFSSDDLYSRARSKHNDSVELHLRSPCLFTPSYGVYFSRFARRLIDMSIVDQLNKILEILGASVAEIGLWVISD